MFMKITTNSHVLNAFCPPNDKATALDETKNNLSPRTEACNGYSSSMWEQVEVIIQYSVSHSCRHETYH